MNDEQSKDRINREPKEIVIIDLIPKTSVDQQVREVLKRKDTQMQQLLDPFARARREREQRDLRERTGLACPPCLKQLNPNHPDLTVVCNTWPTDGAKFLELDICFCGHPWLADAEKNYLNFLFHGEDHASDYPTIEKWLWDQGIQGEVLV
jgi:hypothetical protein